jgi:hypothetical protein
MKMAIISRVFYGINGSIALLPTSFAWASVIAIKYFHIISLYYSVLKSKITINAAELN